MFRPFLSAALLLSVVGGAVAQQGVELKGLTHLGLLIEDLDQDAQWCGVTRDLIRDAIAYTISSSKLKLSDDNGSGPKIYVRVGALVQRQPVQCLSDVKLDVVNFQRVQLDYTDEPPRFVTIQLWHDDWLQHRSIRRSGQPTWATAFLNASC
jgi:hypothetical protein